MFDRRRRWCRAAAALGLALLTLSVGAAARRLPDAPLLGEAPGPAPSVALTSSAVGIPSTGPVDDLLARVFLPPPLSAAAPVGQPYLARPLLRSDETPPAYVVQAGDTLWRVARVLGTSPRALAHVNDFTSTRKRLRTGQTLRVPAARAQAALPRRGAASPALAQSALQYRGVPYRWAGTTTRGMDCSGLVKRVLATHGVNAPHNAAQLYQLGVPVATESLRSGDLVFFGHTHRAGVSHVGIYVGGGQFVHASSGRGVVINNLSDRYYQAHYVGARRVR